MLALLTEAKTHWPACNGIFHLAGTLDDGFARQLDWSRCERVLAAKAYGALHLHECSVELELELTRCPALDKCKFMVGHAPFEHV